MNRNLFLGILVVLVFFCFEFSGLGKATDVEIETSPRAINFRTKINELVAYGGGKVIRPCRASFKHTVLVSCQTSNLVRENVENYLKTDGWERTKDEDLKILKFKKYNDILSIEEIYGDFHISVKAEKP